MPADRKSSVLLILILLSVLIIGGLTFYYLTKHKSSSTALTTLPLRINHLSATDSILQTILQGITTVVVNPLLTKMLNGPISGVQGNLQTGINLYPGIGVVSSDISIAITYIKLSNVQVTSDIRGSYSFANKTIQLSVPINVGVFELRLEIGVSGPSTIPAIGNFSISTSVSATNQTMVLDVGLKYGCAANNDLQVTQLIQVTSTSLLSIDLGNVTVDDTSLGIALENLPYTIAACEQNSVSLQLCQVAMLGLKNSIQSAINTHLQNIAGGNSVPASISKFMDSLASSQQQNVLPYSLAGLNCALLMEPDCSGDICPNGGCSVVNLDGTVWTDQMNFTHTLAKTGWCSYNSTVFLFPGAPTPTTTETVSVNPAFNTQWILDYGSGNVYTATNLDYSPSVGTVIQWLNQAEGQVFATWKRTA